MSGTTPPGTSNEEQAARWVRGMFDRVARRYDLLNHLLSLNIDRYWRRRTVAQLRDIVRRPEAQVMDLCCGTGDLLLALEAERGAAVLGADFSHRMLVEAARKIVARGFGSLVIEADALCLPLPDRSLDLITAAFGFRNLANYEKGLAEMLRVLKPGGVAAILEFSQPAHPVFVFYLRRVLPLVGGAISGSKEAYAYLPASVSKFPSAEELAELMRAAGFEEVRFHKMTGGAVALHVGVGP